MAKRQKCFVRSRFCSARFIFFLLLLVSLAGCGFSLPAVLFDQSDLETMSREVLELTNEERAKADLPPLTWNDTLARAAGLHCQDMIDRDYFAHNTPEGVTPGERATAAGYQWLIVGENLAAGYLTPQQVVTGWMNSPGHRDNILRKEFVELGIALRIAPNGRFYWAQEFGVPYPH